MSDRPEESELAKLQQRFDELAAEAARLAQEAERLNQLDATNRDRVAEPPSPRILEGHDGEASAPAEVERP